MVSRVVSILGSEKTILATEVLNEVTDAFKNAVVERK